jgi:hypothetical protein
MVQLLNRAGAFARMQVTVGCGWAKGDVLLAPGRTRRTAWQRPCSRDSLSTKLVDEEVWATGPRRRCDVGRRPALTERV